MSDPARVLVDALGLQPNERARVAHALILSLGETEPELDVQSLWTDEIGRRINEIEAGTAELEDWEAVRGKLQSVVRR